MTTMLPLPCVRDATTLQGLARLRARHPTSWSQRMRRAARIVAPDATVGEALRAGGMGHLLPRAATSAEANRLKKLRCCGRLLVRVHGHRRISDLDERWLRRARWSAPEDMSVGADLAGAAISLLRRVVHAVQRRAGSVRVHRTLRPKKRRARGEAAQREPAPWGAVEAVMFCPEPRIAAAVAIQAHVGVSPGRVCSMRVGDLDLKSGTARFLIRGTGDGEFEWVLYALPARALQAIRPWWRLQRVCGADAPLFPQRRRPHLPVRDLARPLQAQLREAGVPRFALADVRRLAQTSLRNLGAMRAQVRGSAVKTSIGRPLTHRELARQRRAWSAEHGGQIGRLPKRAPRRCHADEPERRSRRNIRSTSGKPNQPRGGKPTRGFGEFAPTAHTGAAWRPATGRHDLRRRTLPDRPLPEYIGPPIVQQRVVVVDRPQQPAATLDDLALAGAAGFVAGSALGVIARDTVAGALKQAERFLNAADSWMDETEAHPG